MKPIFSTFLSAVLAVSFSQAADDPTYLNQIWQIQLPGDAGNAYKVPVAASGAQDSPLDINPNGARFELWTIKSSPYTEYLLDTRYVGSYVPIGQVVVDSEDMYGRNLEQTGPVPVNYPAMIRRTRADRPFTVYISVTGLRSGASDPAASKSVNLLRHVQSYGVNGTGINLDRTQATLFSQASITQNGNSVLSYTLNSVPGANRSKVRGEERFTVMSLRDQQGTTYDIAPSVLASQFIQIWPVADSTVSGITQNQVIRFAMPTVTIALNDLYPDSSTYAQVYKGNPQLGMTGTIVPGSHVRITESVPQSRLLTIMNYDDTFPDDGRWTMEVVTVTPFGIDRLTYLSFDVDRTLEVNGNLSTIE